MKKPRRLNGAGSRIAAVAVLVGAIVLGPLTANAASSSGSSSKQDVRIVNTADQPVPVAGNVAVSGSVAVSSAPALQIDPAANGVRVTNGSDNPVPVRLSDGRTLFQRYFIMSIDGGQRCETASLSLVPDGHRLVVTGMNVFMYPPTGVGVRNFAQAHRADGSFANLQVPLDKQDYRDEQNNRDAYIGDVRTTLVHEGAYPFFVTICMSQIYDAPPTNSIGVYQGSIVGYVELIG